MCQTQDFWFYTQDSSHLKLVNKLALDGSWTVKEKNKWITWWESCFPFSSLSNIPISQIESVFGVKVDLACVEYLLISLFNTKKF